MYLPYERLLTKFILLLLLTFLAEPAIGQVGLGTKHWDWTKYSPHHESVVAVETESGSGTGVLVHVFENRPQKGGFEGLCLTAHHVVADDAASGSIKVIYRNGKRAKRCKVVASNKKLDVAVLWVWVPKGVEPAKVSSAQAKKGDALEFAGLGGGSTLKQPRHFSSIADSPTNGDQIFASVPLLPGDSGGPVFNSSGHVIGIISGGWFWFDGGVESQSGSKINITWPARACNVSAISKLVQRAIASKIQLAKR